METSETTKTAAFEKQLATFLGQNQYSKVQKRKKGYYVIKPWNDESLLFVLKPDSAPDLIAALNNLILPPRFTAIYHIDSNTMEYIFTLLDKDDSCFSRQFEFIMDGKPYFCKFAEASKQLLVLSKAFRMARQQSSTEYRNLLLLRDYLDYAEKRRASIDDWFTQIKPISFYVSGFGNFDENKMIAVSKHLNFFMEYYDRDSPCILIHSIETEPVKTPKQLQLIELAFPNSISTRRQDPFLLDLALTASKIEESRLQFIYYYQILECAATYYIDDDIRRQLLNIINTPDIHSNTDRYISRVLETVSAGVRPDEEAKIQKVVKVTCAPEIVWKEVQQNIYYFSKTQKFDGGFILEPFVDTTTTLESFRAMWHPTTAVTLRIIRNALVHGRERKFGYVISPTPRNDLLIKPWVAIARRIAEQVIIFSRVT